MAISALALVVASFALTFILLDGANPPAAEGPTGVRKQATSPLSAPSCLEPTEAYVFESLGEMTATVDLVAISTVRETTVGKVIPDPTDSGENYPGPWNTTERTAATFPIPKQPEDGTVEEFPTRFLETSVRIREVFKGYAPSADEITVETLEAAYCTPTDWRKPGTRVLLFLSRGEEAQGIYVPRNVTQSAYIVRGENLVSARNDRFVPVV